MPAINTYIDECGEVVERWGDTCRAEGCDKPIYGTSKGYRGYCSTHGRLFYRNGEPFSVAEIQARAYREAAIAYADEQTWETRLALCEAAARCRNTERSQPLGPNFPMMVAAKPGQRVVDAALAWADCDAEAPLAEYEEVRDEMYRAAKLFRSRLRQLDFVTNVGQDEARRRQRESAAKARAAKAAQKEAA